MLSQEIVDLVPSSLAEGEDPADFETLLTILDRLRKPFHPGISAFEVQKIGGALVCLFVPKKPDQYVKVMQEFRNLFSGVSRSEELQMVFANSVRPAAQLLESIEAIVYRPSLFFYLGPIIDHLKSSNNPRAIEASELRNRFSADYTLSTDDESQYAGTSAWT